MQGGGQHREKLIRDRDEHEEKQDWNCQLFQDMKTSNVYERADDGGDSREKNQGWNLQLKRGKVQQYGGNCEDNPGQKASFPFDQHLSFQPDHVNNDRNNEKRMGVIFRGQPFLGKESKRGVVTYRKKRKKQARQEI